MKTLALLLVLAVAFSAVLSDFEEVELSDQYIHVYGQREEGDYKLYNEEVVMYTKPGKFAKFAKTFYAVNATSITQIGVYDWMRNGVQVSIMKGGPGFQNCTVLFEGQVSQPVAALVVVFGRF